MKYHSRALSITLKCLHNCANKRTYLYANNYKLPLHLLPNHKNMDLCRKGKT